MKHSLTFLVLFLPFLGACSAFDRSIEVAEVVAAIAESGGFLKSEDAAKLSIAVDIAKASSAAAQGQAAKAAEAAEAAQVKIEAVDKRQTDDFWLGIAAVAAGYLARGTPNKGVGGAVARAGRVVTQAISGAPKSPPA